MKTSITIDQLRTMTNEQIKAYCRLYPYESQWLNKDALAHARYAIALLQGTTYLKTGKIYSFLKTVEYRGLIIEVYEDFSWKAKLIDGAIVDESDDIYNFPGEDLKDAIINAKDAINDYLDA